MLCFQTMVRLLVTLTIFMSLHAHAEDLYLSSAEKAIVSLGLKAVLLQQESLKQDDGEYIIKTMIARAKLLATQEKRTVTVESYEEFLRLQKNEELYQNKLANIEVDSLLEVMPDPQYISHSEKVQRRINKYMQQKIQLGKAAAVSALGLSFNFMSDSNDSAKLDNFKVYLKEKIETFTSEFVGRMTKNSKSEYVNVLAKLLKSYFDMLPASQKAEILFRLIQLPLRPEPNDIFLTMIQSTGPQMQKLVQIIGRNPAIPEEFRLIFQKLESQVQAVPWSEVKKLISQEVSLDEFSYFEHAALGVGTMAQTHRVQRKGFAQNVRTFVIRFLKPGIEELVDMDHTILIKIASEIDTDPAFKKYKLPSLRRQVDDIHESVVEELAIQATAANQLKGKGIYEKSTVISFSQQKNILEIHVPDTVIIGKNKKLMQQELIFGKKVTSEVANYKEIYPELFAAVAEEVTAQWLEQAFFKTGFFHADLHQGNLLMKVTDAKVQVNLLDFGMVGQLSEQQRDNVLLLALGLKLNNVDLISDSFSHLTRVPMDWVSKEVFKGEVAKRVQKINLGEEKDTSIESWAAWSISKGLDLHYEFVKLNRGIMAISSLLDESGSKMSFEKIATKLVLNNKATVMSVLAKQDFVKYSDLLKFGFSELTNRKSSTAVADKCVFLFQ